MSVASLLSSSFPSLQSIVRPSSRIPKTGSSQSAMAINRLCHLQERSLLERLAWRMCLQLGDSIHESGSSKSKAVWRITHSALVIVQERDGAIKYFGQVLEWIRRHAALIVLASQT